MARHRRSREIEIFNFSFLDILACTIGLLLFILVMVFILQSNTPVSAAQAAANGKRAAARVASLRRTARRENALADQIDLQFTRSAGDVSRGARRRLSAALTAAAMARDGVAQATRNLLKARAVLATRRKAAGRAAAKRKRRLDAELAAAQKRYQAALAKLAAKQAKIDRNIVRLLPRRHGGGRIRLRNLLFVDCRKNRVVLFHLGGQGRMITLGQTRAGHLDAGGSSYQRHLQTQAALPHGSVLFWVRPNGMATFAAARTQLPPGLKYGFEPADAKWSFAGATIKKHGGH